MNLMHSGFRCVRDWFSLDLRSIALFRIAIALTVLLDLWIRSRDIAAFYTDDGVFPRSAYFNLYTKPWHASLYFSIGQYSQVVVLFLINAAAAVCLLIGYRTRIMAVACWVLLASLHNRNYMLLNGGDTLFRLLLFWGMLLPLGARWSIDRAHRNRPDHPKTSRSGVASVCTFAFIIQVCLVYWVTAVFKSRGTTWHDGSAIKLTLDNPYFTSRFGEWFRDSYDSLLPSLTHATYHWEMLGTLLLFSPVWRGALRTLCVCGFIALHIGILAMMEVGLFPYVSCTAWLALLPGWFWDRGSKLKRSVLNQQAAPIEARGTDRASRPMSRSPDPTLGPVSLWSERLRRASLQLAILATLAYVILWNMRATGNDFARETLRDQYNWYGYLLGLNQSWTMFAPDPPADKGWYVFEVEFIDGERGSYNLLGDGESIEYTRPDAVTDTVPNRRWGKYLYRINYSSYDAHRSHLAAFLKGKWNEEHSREHRAKSITMLYVRPTKSASGDETIDKITVWQR